MPRGGRRNGAPGRSYQNRTDLTQAPKAAPNQQYGAAGQQIEAQKAIPLPNQQMGASVGPPGHGSPAQPMTLPGSLGALDQPTARPGEPITAGMPTGPGPGPEVLPSQPDDFDVTLREMYRRVPNTELLELIEMWERAHPA